MASTAPPTRQRAIALAAGLADDGALGPLDLIDPRALGAEARELAAKLLEGSRGGRAEGLAALEAELGGDSRFAGARLERRDRPLPGLRRVVEVLAGEGAAAAPPAGLRALADGPMPLLAGLTLALLRRAAASEAVAVKVVRGAGAVALEVSPRVAPGLLWLALALSADEAAAEALAAGWPPPLARALLDALARFTLEVSPDDAAEERARLELELASLG